MSIDTSRLRPRDTWNKSPVVLVGVGSFSPITFMHLRLFEMARDELSDHGFEVIGGYLSPVSDHYAKPGLIASEHRVAMCRAALHYSDWLQVDDWEAMQSEWLITAAVLTSFKNRLALAGFDGVRVMLVSGADLVHSFSVPDLWLPEDQRLIASDFGMAVLERTGTDLSAYIFENPILWECRHSIYLIKQHCQNDISSTKVRLLVSRGLSIRYLVPDSVIEYIQQHDLYRM